MTRMEELLSAATRDSGAEVAPGTIRPLDLSQVPFDRPWRPGRGRWTSRRGWARVMRPGILVPTLAALAVVAVVAASLALPRMLPGHARPATPSLEVPDGVPPYYAALTTTGTPAATHPMNVAVRDTWTGQPLATVTPPAGLGTFTFVDGGALDDRTWVVGAQPWKPQRNPVLSWTADNRVLSIATWKDFIFPDPAKPSGDLLAASRVVPFTGKAPTGITYTCGATGAVLSLDGKTMTCGGSPSTDDGIKVQSTGVITISARTGVPLHYTPVRRYGAWVTGAYMDLYWASPAEAGTYIGLPLELNNRQAKAAATSLSVWRHGKVAATIPFATETGSLIWFVGRNSVAW